LAGQLARKKEPKDQSCTGKIRGDIKRATKALRLRELWGANVYQMGAPENMREKARGKKKN